MFAWNRSNWYSQLLCLAFLYLNLSTRPIHCAEWIHNSPYHLSTADSNGRIKITSFDKDDPSMVSRFDWSLDLDQPGTGNSMTWNKFYPTCCISTAGENIYRHEFGNAIVTSERCEADTAHHFGFTSKGPTIEGILNT